MRLSHDLRRKGTNKRVISQERLVLPRTKDLVAGIVDLLQAKAQGEGLYLLTLEHPRRLQAVARGPNRTPIPGWNSNEWILLVSHSTIRTGLLHEQIWETRLSEVIQTATSSYLSALDSYEQATAKLHVQKAAQEADEAWQQNHRGTAGTGCPEPDHRIPGTPAPPPKRRTAMTWTSQRPGRAV